MLKRVYVDNFRTLVNFDLPLRELTLLLGPNGSGKTTVFEAVHAVRDFLCAEKTSNDLFPTGTLTRWETRDTQVFELALGEPIGEFVYHLEIQHDRIRQRCRVKSERLLHDGHTLYESKVDDAQLRARLYRDNYGVGPEVLVDWSRSGVASIQPRPDNTLLTSFKKRMERVVVARLNPAVMGAFADQESVMLAWDASNFVAWFRYVASSDLDLMAKLRPALTEVIVGLDTLSLAKHGDDAKALVARFRLEEAPGAGGVSYSCRFDELSDGERVLLVLYALLECAGPECTLCLDEPENFLALREIQPWLNMVIDKAQSQAFQTVLISHHPELINALAVGAGRWLERPSGGPTRSREITDDGSGLAVADLVARGWLHE